MTQPSTPEAHSFFEATWRVYRKIVDGNHMFHREIFTRIQAALVEYGSDPLSILDLGCGDAGQMGPILRVINLKSYLGVDASEPALELAQTELKTLGAKASLRCIDMLAFLREPGPARFDIILASFSLHHFTTSQKREFLSLCRAHLMPEGALIIVDVFREDGQSLQDYLASYCQEMRNEWEALTPDDLEMATHHVSTFDLPETPEDFMRLAESEGLRPVAPMIQHGFHGLLFLKDSG